MKNRIMLRAYEVIVTVEGKNNKSRGCVLQRNLTQAYNKTVNRQLVSTAVVIYKFNHKNWLWLFGTEMNFTVADMQGIIRINEMVE